MSCMSSQAITALAVFASNVSFGGTYLQASACSSIAQQCYDAASMLANTVIYPNKPPEARRFRKKLMGNDHDIQGFNGAFAACVLK
eukprot:5356799-Amphidinium_carterae.3